MVLRYWNPNRINNQNLSLSRLQHSHNKRKDSLEGSLDQVLFAAELEFPKILVPRLPQHTSNVNIECVGKLELSKQLYSLCVILITILAKIYLRQTLVLVWNSALRKSSTSIFEQFFASIDKILIFWGRLGTRLWLYEGLRSC